MGHPAITALLVFRKKAASERKQCERTANTFFVVSAVPEASIRYLR
jgi:hypothetical protein